MSRKYNGSFFLLMPTFTLIGKGRGPGTTVWRGIMEASTNIIKICVWGLGLRGLGSGHDFWDSGFKK